MQLTVKLPDGSDLQYDEPVTSARVARDISPRLAKAAVASEVDGKLCDLNNPLAPGTHQLKIVTDSDPRALEIMRHTAAHVLAQAVVQLYGKDVQYTIGPALTDDFQYGFYYDFALGEPLGTEDLPKIEKQMQEIISQKIPLERIEVPPAQASAEFAKIGQDYKVEMIDDLVRDEGVSTVALYRQGDFLDMCRGPHLPHTGRIKVFKLLAVAGAYWRGDQSKAMLTRIYGTAFFDAKSLNEHMERIEEAKRRDHRVLGKQLGLFLLSESVGPGLPIWMPNGTIIRAQLQGWLQDELIRRGFKMVCTPHIGRLDLYRTSGHYPYYKDAQFPPIMMDEQDGYLLKPMNCPHHVQIYKFEQRSYRDLPLRLAEFGTVYRMEQSGELNGMIRCRGFTQDDAHIFCTPEQLETEIESCVEVTELVLSTLGLQTYRVRIGLRDSQSGKYVGNMAGWNLAEANIRSAVRKLNMDYVEEPGEACFYGPKIDYIVTDCIGREWQLGTIQVDYNIPERFELQYAGRDNRPHRPVMIHRAPFGSLERFIGILIEHYAGAFPLWLAPVQVTVLPVSDKFAAHAESVTQRVREAGIRVELDGSAEKIGAKIRKGTLQKIPYMAVVGAREVEADTVAVRHRTQGDRGQMAVNRFVAALKEEIASKGRRTALEVISE
ncbi:MAG: threonine--tRNA ligase [Phycisphaerae bacterium]|nr:threonine--tRNA ligase [Phycisphaerae bacterium]